MMMPPRRKARRSEALQIVRLISIFFLTKIIRGIGGYLIEG